MMYVNRIGFFAVRSKPPVVGCQEGLQSVLNQMVTNGHRIVSVSVMRSLDPTEQYEVYITSEFDDTTDLILKHREQQRQRETP